MIKVIVWGAAGEYANYRNILALMQEKLIISIQGIIDRRLIQMDVKECDGYTVFSENELVNLDYDLILIAACSSSAKCIIENLSAIKVECDKYMLIGSFVAQYDISKEYYQKERNEQIKIIKEILSASDEELKDYNWMLEKVRRYGIRCLSMDWMNDSKTHWSINGILQIPEEFASLCCLLAKQNIKDAIEIGVWKGLSSYFMCAVLSRINNNLKYYMVDVCDQLEDFEQFFELLPGMKKCIPATSGDFIKDKFDFVFIDADHSYNASIMDWHNVGRNASIITAFHDIYAHEYDQFNGGTVRMWKEICENTCVESRREFVKYPDERMGIGVIMHKKRGKV